MLHYSNHSHLTKYNNNSYNHYQKSPLLFMRSNGPSKHFQISGSKTTAVVVGQLQLSTCTHFRLTIDPNSKTLICTSLCDTRLTRAVGLMGLNPQLPRSKNCDVSSVDRSRERERERGLTGKSCSSVERKTTPHHTTEVRFFPFNYPYTGMRKKVGANLREKFSPATASPGRPCHADA